MARIGAGEGVGGEQTGMELGGFGSGLEQLNRTQTNRELLSKAAARAIRRRRAAGAGAGSGTWQRAIQLSTPW